MRCYTVAGAGFDSLQLAERSAPGVPARGEAVIDVHAVSLNYRDLLVATGGYGGVQDPPIVAASDMAGVVAAVGEGVTELSPGDRVLNAPVRDWPAGRLRADWAQTFVGGQGVDGVLAQQIAYPAASLVKLSNHLSLEEGSTLPIAALTAWAAVVTHGQTGAGEWVLLHGTGGVSIFAAQIARLSGARVIQSTSSEEKARLLRETFGVEETFDYREDDWARRVCELTGGGVDVVVDVVGGDSLAQSLKCCNYGARVAVIGVLAGLESQINVFDLIRHQVTMRGIFMESAAELRALVRAFEAGKVHPHIDRVFPFDQARAAYDYMQSQKHVGKVVIKLR